MGPLSYIRISVLLGTQSEPQEEGMENPEGQKDSTGGSDLMAASGNETVRSTVAVTWRWWHFFTQRCTIL